MRINLKLAQIGLILIVLPLIVELIPVSCLAYLLNEANSQAAAENRAKELLLHTTKLRQLFEDAGTALFGFKRTNSEVFLQRYESLRKELEPELNLLRENKFAGDDQSQLFKQIEVDSRSAIELLNKAKSIVETSSEDVIEYRIETQYKLLKNILSKFETDVNRFTERESQIRVTRSAALDALRANINTILLLMIALPFIVAVVSALLFGRYIFTRLNVLRENSLRLASAEELLKPLGGSDEIAQVDASFHGMASALADARTKEKAIIDNAVDVICSIDKAGKFSEISPSVHTAWGYNQDEIVGRRLITLIDQNEAPVILEQLQKCQAAEGNVSFESTVKRKDGTAIELSWTGCWSEENQMTFLIAHDESEKKKMERLKREFVQMISHDLRSPLTSVQCFLELVSDGFYDNGLERLKQKATASEHDITRLIRLVSNLLDIEKMESGRMEISPAVVEVGTIIEQSADSMRNFAERKEISIVTSNADFTVFADEHQIVQVLVNLISNAIKFSPKQGLISISANNDDKFAEFRVTDNGRGIPETVREKIFNRFEQVELNDQRLKGGTGLGLAICKSIVEAHKGSIGVESTEGEGSTFWFKIPVTN